jgi:uridine kinase
MQDLTPNRAFLSEIVRSVRAKPRPSGMSTKVIAVDGPGGAGKSTFAARLAEELGGAQVLHTDDFASWENPIDWWPRLVKEVLEPLSCNQSARYRRTDWGNPGHEEWGEVAPAEFVILEGVTASREAFRPFLTYSVWIETPRELRLSRGLERDGEEARAQWEEWIAEEEDYVRRERPRERADLVLPGDQDLWR